MLWVQYKGGEAEGNGTSEFHKIMLDEQYKMGNKVEVLVQSRPLKTKDEGGNLVSKTKQGPGPAVSSL